VPTGTENTNQAQAPQKHTKETPQGEPQPPAHAQDAPVFPVPPTPAPTALPLPRPLPAEHNDAERRQRSSAWLKQLDDATQQPARPISRSRPISRTRPLKSRRKKLFTFVLVPLSILLVLAALLVSIPGLQERALGLLTGSAAATASPQGALIAQSNVAGSVLRLNNLTYPLSTQVNGGWSVTVPHLNSGTYSLTISAPNYAPASGRVGILPSLSTAVRAFLTLDKSVYTSLLPPANNLIPGQALAATIPTGAQYLVDQTAAQALKVSIGYRVLSLVDTPDPSVLMVGDIGSPAPKTLLSGVVVPVAVFTDATTGAVVDETHPNALSPDHFLLALTVGFDSSNKASFALATPDVLKATTPSDTAVTVPGGISADPALLFVLVGLSQVQGITANDFTCFGLLDAATVSGNQPSPEDGFLFGVDGGAAHYFFRWGQVWTTNAAAHTLTPGLPEANQDTLVQAQTILDAASLGQATGCK
jgi:hypothetical protein